MARINYITGANNHQCNRQACRRNTHAMNLTYCRSFYLPIFMCIALAFTKTLVTLYPRSCEIKLNKVCTIYS